MLDRESTRQREQAEQIGLAWDVDDPQLGRSLIIVNNSSASPIREITAVVQTGDNVAPSPPLNCDVMVSAGFGNGWVMPPPITPERRGFPCSGLASERAT